MSAETKAKAKAKLATYNPKIGYPKKWRDYSALRSRRATSSATPARRAFEYDRDLAKLGKPVDRDEWGMTPMTVNAYYNPALNEIVFPAAILQPPFFDPNADDAVNYGGIGAVIGHEISHGFDDQGSQYDAKGKLATGGRRRTTRSSRPRRQSSSRSTRAFGRCPAQRVNGELTLGENIADLAASRSRYNAYQALAERQAGAGDRRAHRRPAVLPRLGPGVARQDPRRYQRRQLLVTDPHSPERARVDVPGAQAVDAFYAAYGAEVRATECLVAPGASRQDLVAAAPGRRRATTIAGCPYCSASCPRPTRSTPSPASLRAMASSIAGRFWRRS